MKKIAVIFILIFSVNLFAGINSREVFLEYYSNQNFENFLKAYTFFNLSAEIDTTQAPDISYYYLMSIHKMEYQNHLNYLVENVDKYGHSLQFQIANNLLDGGQFDKAVEIYKLALASRPDWSCAWRHKGEAYFRMKDMANAERALLKSIETRIDHYDAYLMLADVYYQNKKFKNALSTIEKAFEYQAIDAKDEEGYPIEDVHFLYLNILKANRSRKARAFENELREKYPDSPHWNK